jgi:hypothetical protein
MRKFYVISLVIAFAILAHNHYSQPIRLFGWWL